MRVHGKGWVPWPSHHGYFGIWATWRTSMVWVVRMNEASASWLVRLLVLMTLMLLVDGEWAFAWEDVG